MGINLYKDWPVYVLLGAVIFFFVSIVISGRMQEKKEKEANEKGKG